MAAGFGPGPGAGPRVHDVGAAGLVTVAAEGDDVRIRGVDGGEARVVVPGDGAGIETTAEPGRFEVRARSASGRAGFVGVQIGGRGFGFPLGFATSGTIELEVPRDARVEVHTSTGDITLRDVRGGVTVRTAAGDVALKRVAGRVAVEVASGNVHVAAAGPLALTARSMSGDVTARAPRFDVAAIETVSGDVELAGSFAAGPAHAVSTVSGDVELAMAGGLTLEVKAVSGDVDCSHPDRRSGDGRRRPLVIGDGAATLAVRTMSGDVEVRQDRPPARGPEGTDQGDRSPAFGARPAAAPQPPPPPVAPAPAARPAVSPLPAGEPTGPTAGGTALAGSPPDAAPALDGPGMLATLEALARGEIDVLEAERRLDSRAVGEAHVVAGPAADPAADIPAAGPAGGERRRG